MNDTGITRRVFLTRLAALGSLATAFPTSLLAELRAANLKNNPSAWTKEHTWRTLAAVRDNRRARVEFSWAAVETSVIRLSITRPCRFDHTARLFEIILYRGDTPIRLDVLHGDATSPEPRPTWDRVDDERLLSAFVPLAFERFEAGRHGPRNQAMLQQYYDSMLAWSQLLGKHFQTSKKLCLIVTPDSLITMWTRSCCMTLFMICPGLMMCCRNCIEC